MKYFICIGADYYKPNLNTLIKKKKKDNLYTYDILKINTYNNTHINLRNKEIILGGGAKNITTYQGPIDARNVENSPYEIDLDKNVNADMFDFEFGELIIQKNRHPSIQENDMWYYLHNKYGYSMATQRLPDVGQSGYYNEDFQVTDRTSEYHDNISNMNYTDYVEPELIWNKNYANRNSDTPIVNHEYNIANTLSYIHFSNESYLGTELSPYKSVPEYEELLKSNIMKIN